jgi:hypothetical protein
MCVVISATFVCQKAFHTSEREREREREREKQTPDVVGISKDQVFVKWWYQ